MLTSARISRLRSAPARELRRSLGARRVRGAARAMAERSESASSSASTPRGPPTVRDEAGALRCATQRGGIARAGHARARVRSRGGGTRLCAAQGF